jgi:hypothetical protein
MEEKISDIQPIDNYYLHRLESRLTELRAMRAIFGFITADPWLEMLNGKSSLNPLICADLDERIDLISRAIKREKSEIGKELFDKIREPLTLPISELRRIPFL